MHIKINYFVCKFNSIRLKEFKMTFYLCLFKYTKIKTYLSQNITNCSHPSRYFSFLIGKLLWNKLQNISNDIKTNRLKRNLHQQNISKTLSGLISQMNQHYFIHIFINLKKLTILNTFPINERTLKWNRTRNIYCLMISPCVLSLI